MRLASAPAAWRTGSVNRKPFGDHVLVKLENEASRRWRYKRVEEISERGRRRRRRAVMFDGWARGGVGVGGEGLPGRESLSMKKVRPPIAHRHLRLRE